MIQTEAVQIAAHELKLTRVSSPNPEFLSYTARGEDLTSHRQYFQQCHQRTLTVGEISGASTKQHSPGEEQTDSASGDSTLCLIPQDAKRRCPVAKDTRVPDISWCSTTDAAMHSTSIQKKSLSTRHVAFGRLLPGRTSYTRSRP